jgi:S-adenosylmethionine decarboxylase
VTPDIYENSGAWWLESTIDIFHCDPEIIRNADAIKDYVWELCELIDMKTFGDTQVVHFWEDEKVAGYSMTQLIETSLISWHFANATNAAYLNAFSCKYYDPLIAGEFSKDFFKWEYYKLSTNLRDGQ